MSFTCLESQQKAKLFEVYIFIQPSHFTVLKTIGFLLSNIHHELYDLMLLRSFKIKKKLQFKEKRKNLTFLPLIYQVIFDAGEEGGVSHERDIFPPVL